MDPSLDRRRFLALAVGAALLPTVRAADNDPTGVDPLGSLQWPGLRRQYIGAAPMRFSEQVSIKSATFADDPMNVPVLVDARTLATGSRGVRRVVVVADRNPIREVLEFQPVRALPFLGFRIRLEQASPVRALVQTHDGHWHVGGVWIEAAGGGCTLPGTTRSDGSWSRTLNQVHARFFDDGLAAARRLRLRVMHPMDTGLVAGIPAFFLETLELRDDSGDTVWRLYLREPVSENPIFTFELPAELQRRMRLLGHDNNGNRIDTEIGA